MPPTPSEPSIPPSAKPGVKQQRDARRAEKLIVLKKKQANQKRNRIITLVASAVAGIGILALVITFVVTSSVPKVDPASIEIEGLKDFGTVTSVHVDDTKVDYEAKYDMNPPAGGDHWSSLLNCGVYTEVQENEQAVHSLEHGAVWVTYDPDTVTNDDMAVLLDELPDTYVVVSPFPGLSAPIVASAWANQVELDGVDDPRLADFVAKFWKSADAPEPGAPCTGGVDGAGKVA